MQLFDDPIIETLAEAIVIPVAVGGGIVPGSLHEEFARSSSDDYLRLYHTDVRHAMVPGAIRAIQNKTGRWKDVWFVHIPVSTDTVTFQTLHSSLDKVFNIWRASGWDQLAVPKVHPRIPWEIQEHTWARLEGKLDGDQEVWAYTAEDPTDGDEPWGADDGVVIPSEPMIVTATSKMDEYDDALLWNQYAGGGIK